MGQENKSDDKTEMTGGQTLINSLYEEGVRVIFGLPGVQMYHAVIPVLDYPDMKFITTRHEQATTYMACLLYTSPSPRDRTRSRMPSSA